MKKTTIFLACLILSSAPHILFADKSCDHCIYPPSDPITDVSLLEYLQKLTTAVESKNGDQLLSLMDKKILLTFGPPSSQSTEEILELNNPNSPTWQHLNELLTLGGDYMGNYYCLPYTYVHFPGNLDAYSHYVVTQKSAAAHSTADPSSDVITYLRYEIVRTDMGAATSVIGKDEKLWTKIYLDGKVAFLPSESLRSPNDARVCLEKGEQGWSMKHFVFGD